MPTSNSMPQKHLKAIVDYHYKCSWKIEKIYNQEEHEKSVIFKLPPEIVSMILKYIKPGDVVHTKQLTI